MLKQVLLVIGCYALATVRAQNPCLGAPTYLSHSFVAAPESCDAYIICMGGETIRGQSCQAGYFFEPVNQVCGQSSCLDCSPFGIQNLPYPNDCVQYIECVMGFRTVRSCPNNLIFDRSIGNCNLASETICPYDPPTDAPTTQDPSAPTTVDPWAPTTVDPWAPTTVDPWAPTTVDPWAPTQPPPTQPPTQPPGGDRPVCIPGQVHHAHPSDCTRFFLCINLVLWEQQCPNDLHWNQLINTCDLPASAGCVVGPGPPGGGTPAPIPTDPPLFPPIPINESVEQAEIPEYLPSYADAEPLPEA